MRILISLSFVLSSLDYRTSIKMQDAGDSSCWQRSDKKRVDCRRLGSRRKFVLSNR